ncbi:MAG: hypothetical protein QXT34_03025 [Candidatus Aenigmatarchaeota archaeon]
MVVSKLHREIFKKIIENDKEKIVTPKIREKVEEIFRKIEGAKDAEEIKNIFKLLLENGIEKNDWKNVLYVYILKLSLSDFSSLIRIPSVLERQYNKIYVIYGEWFAKNFNEVSEFMKKYNLKNEKELFFHIISCPIDYGKDKIVYNEKRDKIRKEMLEELKYMNSNLFEEIMKYFTLVEISGIDEKLEDSLNEKLKEMIIHENKEKVSEIFISFFGLEEKDKDYVKDLINKVYQSLINRAEI